MNYKNANHILPDRLVQEIQQYVQSEYIYIPIKDKVINTAPTEYEQELLKRNEHIYTYYTEFVKEDLDNLNNNDDSLKPENMYVWSDGTYEYSVVMDYLSNGGFVGMSRVDNDDTHTVELAITRWENDVSQS